MFYPSRAHCLSCAIIFNAVMNILICTSLCFCGGRGVCIYTCSSESLMQVTNGPSKKFTVLHFFTTLNLLFFSYPLMFHEPTTWDHFFSFKNNPHLFSFLAVISADNLDTYLVEKKLCHILQSHLFNLKTF